MNKITIEVPKGIQYISEWTEYTTPDGHSIVDKGVTGCGYTEFCLTNSEDIVLCSPRKILLENKVEQHQGEENIYYLQNDVENFGDTQTIKEKIIAHILKCKTILHLSCKILVTYDSCKYVVEALKELRFLKDFKFVVDEFQSIFLDSYFKAETEFDFVDNLQSCPNVLYLSATPMLEKYLDKVPEFQNLPFYSLDWSRTGYTENVRISRKFVKSLVSECGKIIQDYKNGVFPFVTTSSKGLVFSKEVIFYLNSVGDIIKIINKNKLLPSQVNIICSYTPENKTKLKKIGHSIGKIPLKGEPNKMFTFCTRSAYIGADFYSTNASTIVMADPNITSLALDISLDLSQIAGRLRDKTNPFKNEITLFYRTIRKNEIVDRVVFDDLQKQRQKETKDLLDVCQSATESQRLVLIKKIRDSIDKRNYSDDFVSISSKTGLPVYNTFIEIANERAWEVSQRDYQDKISVTRSLEEQGYGVQEYRDHTESIVQDFLDNHFYKTGIFREKLRMYCEFMDSCIPEDLKEISEILEYKIQDSRFKRLYDYFGTSRCRSFGFEEKPLMSQIMNLSKEAEYQGIVLREFRIGERYTMKFIKQTLQKIRDRLGISGVAKATDLGEYFKLTKTNITLPDKTISRGFKLESL